MSDPPIPDGWLIADLYDAAIDPDRWPELLERAARSVGARGAVIHALNTLDPKAYRVARMSTLYDEDDARLYESEYARYEEPTLARVIASEPHSIVIDEDFTERPEVAALRPDVRFLRERYGVYERFGTRLNGDGGWFDCFACQFAEDRGGLRPAEREVLRVLQPHLTQVLFLSRTFGVLRTRFRAVLTVLDRIDIAIFVVTERRDVIVSNATADALVEEGGVVALDPRGRLRASQPKTEALLGRAIEAACATARHLGRSASEIVAVMREGGDPCLIEISPLHDTDAEIDPALRGALVSVVDPELRSALDLRRLDMAYGLSGAEIDIATHVVGGLGYADIAEVRGVTPETIKTQVRSLYRKTGSRNRTELVRRILALNVPIKR